MPEFGLAFVATTVLLASVLAAPGLTTDLLRLLSEIALALVGLALVAGPTGQQVIFLFEPFQQRAVWVVGLSEVVNLLPDLATPAPGWMKNRRR